MARKALDKWQFGDFQTPDELAEKVVQVLKANHKVDPRLIIEPSCGTGSFVRAALMEFPRSQILAFDVNPSYVQDAVDSIQSLGDNTRASVETGDFFLIDWDRILKRVSGNVLVLGNPPWVTSSELGMLNSKNLPEKSNFQSRRGIEAITGSGNFDISEWMLLKHIEWLSDREGSIALLCKYSVARKVMRQVRMNKEHRYFGHIYHVDAKRYFAASVEACLFVLTTEQGNADCEVYANLDTRVPSYVIGARDGYVVKDVEKYGKWRSLLGHEAAYIWRSGLKHDCSKVMELEPIGERFRNGFQEHVELEDDFVFPLLKSSDVGNSRTSTYRKAVIVTQRYVGEDTSTITAVAPKTWAYLASHARYLDSRRSSIYRGKPSYSIFGIGEYTFRNWKVAISGLYKRLNFCLVGPINGKPVAFDDTVNFLSFDTREEADFVFKLVTSRSALEFYESMIFWDDKRPITTNILRRLSLRAVAQYLGREDEYRYFAEKSKPAAPQQPRQRSAVL